MATDNDIDYRQMTRAELSEALSNIDAQRFPQNHAHLLAEIAYRNSGGRSEPAPTVPAEILRLRQERGDVRPSLATKVIYGGFGAFYFLMPICLMAFVPQKIAGPVSAVVATAIIWLIAALFLFGLCVTYRFESGLVTCLLFSRHILWKERLDTLKKVESNDTRGLPTLHFVWPDRKRRLWLRMSDLGDD
jgi:hypothetical protein